MWTLGDAFQGVLIMGENGSGKTSGSGELLARKYLKAGFGGLVLCFKTDEAALWRQYLYAPGVRTMGAISAPITIFDLTSWITRRKAAA